MSTPSRADDAASPPVYELRPEIDAPVMVVLGTVAAGWLLRRELAPAYCAPRCDRGSVNPIDRPVAGNWSPGWSTASDIGVLAVLGGAVVTELVDAGWRSGLTDLVVVAETVLAANASAVVSNMGSRRPRPFLYSERAPLDARDDGNGALSFFSGHTAASFAATTALFTTLHRRHPHAWHPWFVLAAGMAASGFVATGRMLSGNHFPSDVVAGAGVGTALGFLIPALHDAPVRLSPATGLGPGVSLTGTF